MAPQAAILPRGNYDVDSVDWPRAFLEQEPRWIDDSRTPKILVGSSPASSRYRRILIWDQLPGHQRKWETVITQKLFTSPGIDPIETTVESKILVT